jgi:uncharacterized damage-inducible protein DinB
MPDPNLSYPIGRFRHPESATPEERGRWLAELRAAPSALRSAVVGLDDNRLDTPYRPGGWSVRQVVHHVPDSHLSSYIRFKWALTEPTPTIKAYDEKTWAELPDSRGEIEPSLALLEALHLRWVSLLEALDEDEWKRRFVHPESGSEIPLYANLALYAWHGRHHTAHIMALRRRMGW